ncbi:MAG TPA: glycoside hydrolase N-terminal domain-containing protein, partial [Microbacterium sp.]|nr:glycoside hydrolase N-terminal domain-containing protein [Microbacterium sp.]
MDRDDLHVLEYAQPAAVWTEALPLGDGRHGAMCFGGTRTTRIQLNDDTAWSGSPRSERRGPLIDRAHAERAIAQARRAIDDGRPLDADGPLRSLQHRHSQAYVAFAELEIDVIPARTAARRAASATPYRRRLDLRTATHTSSGEVDGVPVIQRSWITAEHGVLVHEIEAFRPVDVVVRLSTPLRELARERGGDTQSLLLRLPSDVRPPHDRAASPVEYSDDPDDALQGAVTVTVEHDGLTHGDIVRGATRVRLILTTQTTFTRIGADPAGDARTALAVA